MWPDWLVKLFADPNTIISGIVLFLFGGGVTIGAFKFDVPGMTALKQLIISEKDAALRLGSLRSTHIVTVIFQKARQGEKKEPATLRHMNTAAVNFFGYDEGSEKRLLGKTGIELMDILRKYINPDDFARFQDDQLRVQELIQQRRHAQAGVPMIINHTHPFEQFRNKKFFPIIAHISEDKKGPLVGRKHGEFMTVLYLDLSVLPELP